MNQRFISRSNIPTVKTQLYQILSILAIVAYFIPIVLVLITKRWKEPAFRFLSIYWLLNGCINLLGKIELLDSQVYNKLTLVYNMMDVPLVMGILWWTTSSKYIKKTTALIAPGLLLSQLSCFIVLGWEHESAKYVMAVSLISILFLLFWEISLYMQKLEHSASENAMVFIHVSWLFAYGTFVVIYIFEYYVKISGAEIDNFLIYYISSLIAVSIASIGFGIRKGSEVPMNRYHGY